MTLNYRTEDKPDQELQFWTKVVANIGYSLQVKETKLDIPTDWMFLRGGADAAVEMNVLMTCTYVRTSDQLLSDCVYVTFGVSQVGR